MIISSQLNVPVVSYFLSYFGKCNVGLRSNRFLGITHKKVFNISFKINLEITGDVIIVRSHNSGKML